MSQVMEVTDNTFSQEVLESEKPVLVDFWAPWCGPCKMVAPVVEDIASEMSDQVKVCKINVDENTDTASDYGVMSIPTLLIMQNGEIQDQVVGYLPKEELKQKLEEHI